MSKRSAHTLPEREDRGLGRGDVVRGRMDSSVNKAMEQRSESPSMGWAARSGYQDNRQLTERLGNFDKALGCEHSDESTNASATFQVGGSVAGDWRGTDASC